MSTIGALQDDSEIRKLPWWGRRLESWIQGSAAGQITIYLPDGKKLFARGDNAGPIAEFTIHRARMVRRILMSGDIGLFESYRDGDWSTPDIAQLLEFGLRNEEALSETLTGTPASALINRIRHKLHANTKRGSRKNIAFHYDLGNAFYAKWLDETMTYSSGLFRDTSEDLAEAQRNKYRRIAEQLALKPQDRVLEIGCGWGGFAELAAEEFGCHVTGLTISKEQLKFAKERIQRAGMSNRAKFYLEDYRDMPGLFDKIVSIEMFEAVGEEYWPAYFDVVRERLKPGGKAALQIITIADERFEAYRKGVDFIQKYIFPGGLLPSRSVLKNVVEQSGLTWKDEAFFGVSYADTLKLWHERFLDNWDNIRPLGFDEQFKRLWTYYLSYCEAGFRAGSINVGQLVIERP